MAGFRHASQIKWLVLGCKESQALQNEIACEFYQESRKDMQTDQGETRQDCFKHSHLRESRATIHTNYSPESGDCMNKKTDYEQYVEWCKVKSL